MTVESTQSQLVPVFKKVSGSTSVDDSWQLTNNGKNLFFVNDGDSSTGHLFLRIESNNIVLTPDRSQATEVQIKRVSWTGDN